MKKRNNYQYVSGIILIIFAVISFFTDKEGQILSISFFGLSLVILPSFKIIEEKCNTKFSIKKRIWLGIGSLFIPFIVVSDNIQTYNVFVSLLSTVFFWIAMFSIKSKNENEKIKCQINSDEIVSTFEEIKNESSEDTINEHSEKLTNNLLDNINEKSKKIIEKNNEYIFPSVDLISNQKSCLFKSIIKKYDESNNQILLGKCNKQYYIENLESMPNLLICGSVMTGKTSFLNSIISSILLKKHPDDLKLIIIDPKGIDYQQYNGIPHLMEPVVDNISLIEKILKTTSNEVDARCYKLKLSRTKDFDAYNKMASNEYKLKKILLIIDDLNYFDYNKSSLDYIEHITTLGWKVGIHVIISCSSLSSSILPTVSRINFPARLSFRVTSSIESRKIINRTGAEKISSIGECLYMSSQTGDAISIKVPFISDDDINKIVSDIKINNGG